MSKVEMPEITVDSGVTFVKLGREYGNLDETSLDEVRQFLFRVLEESGTSMVAIDFSQTRYFGSAFLGVLFRVWKRVTRTQTGKFAFCGMTPESHSIVHTARLDTLWKLYDTRADVIREFTAA